MKPEPTTSPLSCVATFNNPDFDTKRYGCRNVLLQKQKIDTNHKEPEDNPVGPDMSPIAGGGGADHGGTPGGAGKPAGAKPRVPAPPGVLPGGGVPGESDESKKPKSGKGGKGSKKKKCDPSPQSNPVFYMFCIINEIQKPVVNPLGGFLEFGQSSRKIGVPDVIIHRHVQGYHLPISFIIPEDIQFTENAVFVDHTDKRFSVSSFLRRSRKLLHSRKFIIHPVPWSWISAKYPIMERCRMFDPKKKCDKKKKKPCGCPGWGPPGGKPQKMPVPGKPSTTPRSLAGATAVLVEDGNAALVFGGYTIEKTPNDFSGDTLYSNDIFWFSTSFDDESRTLKSYGMHWYGPLEFPHAPSPRAYHSSSLIAIGAKKLKAMLVFGGYDGMGPQGYKSDIHLLVNIERSEEETEMIYQWKQKAQLKLASIENTLSASTYEEKSKTQSIQDLEGCREGKGPCHPSFDSAHPMPWDADSSLRTWSERDGPLAKYFGIGKPWDNSPTWIPFHADGLKPTGREKHTTTVVGHHLFFFGGFGSSGFLNDLHILDFSRMVWESVGSKEKSNERGERCVDEEILSSECSKGSIELFHNYKHMFSGKFPSPRSGHTMATWGKNIVIFGGLNKAVGIFDDVHVLDTKCAIGLPGSDAYGQPQCSFPLKRMIWREIITLGHQPSPRWGHAMWNVFPKSPQLLVFGGFSGGGEDQNENAGVGQLGYRNDNAMLNLNSPTPKHVAVPEYGVPPQTIFHTLHPELPKDILDKYIKFKYSIPKPACPGGSVPSSGRGWKPLFEPIKIKVQGTGFGSTEQKTSAIGVLIGDRQHGPFPCMPIKFVSNTELECTVSPGFGRDLDIIVFANNQITRPGNALFSYEPPRILSVIPPFLIDFCYKKGSYSNCLPRGPVMVVGTNLGSNQEAVQSIVFGGAPCLSWLHVSPMAVVCTCVGESKKDKFGNPLQGGAIIKVGGQYSNAQQFPLLGPPASLTDVWYPVVCPLQSTMEKMGFDLQMARKVRADEIFRQKSKIIAETMLKSLDADSLDNLNRATAEFVAARDELHLAMRASQNSQVGPGLSQLENIAKQVERDRVAAEAPVTVLCRECSEEAHCEDASSEKSEEYSCCNKRCTPRVRDYQGQYVCPETCRAGKHRSLGSCGGHVSCGKLPFETFVGSTMTLVTHCEGHWNGWQACDCDYRTQTRHFQIDVHPENGGNACPRPKTRGCECRCELCGVKDGARGMGAPFCGEYGCDVWENPQQPWKNYQISTRRRRLQSDTTVASAEDDEPGGAMNDRDKTVTNDSLKNEKFEAAEQAMAVRKRQGLTLPVPALCKISESKFPDSTSMIEGDKLGTIYVTKECRCGSMLARVKRRGFLTMTDIQGTCKSALGHFAWKRHCKLQKKTYRRKCERKYPSPMTVIGAKDYHTVEISNSLAGLSRYFHTSVDAPCVALRQLINMRCVEEGEAMERSSGKRWIPWSPFDPNWSPFLNEERSPPLGETNRSYSLVRFQEALTKNIGDRISEGTTPSTLYQPITFIHPSRKPNPVAVPDPSTVRKAERFKGLILHWGDKTCMPGKPPFPRRSMASVGPLADGISYFLFGGQGLLPKAQGAKDAMSPGDTLNSDSASGFTNNFKLASVTFADTFLITSLENVAEDTKRCFGIIDGQCQIDKAPKFGSPAGPPNITDNINNNEGNGNIAPGA